MPNAFVSKRHVLSKFLAKQSVVGISHITFWRKQNQCNFMRFKKSTLRFALLALLVFLHGTAQLQEVGPWPWLLTGCQPQCMNCIPHVQCDTSWTMPMVATITLACTFACAFFCGLDFGLPIFLWLGLWLAYFFVAWTLACTFFVAWTLACTFFVAWTLACTFFVAWTLACTFFCGLDFGLHFILWLGLWLALWHALGTMAFNNSIHFELYF